MSNYNRDEQLKSIHEQRRKATVLKVDNAMKKLIKRKESISFNSISEESGVSRSTLYNNNDLKSRINSLIAQQSQAPSRLM